MAAEPGQAERVRLALGALTSRLLFALSLVLIATAPAGSGAVEIPVPETLVGAWAQTIPVRLPRSESIPIALRTGFTSAARRSSATPELSRIVFEIGRGVQLQTAGLPRCPLSKLYAGAVEARQSCAGSLLGHGSVSSEITLPGQAPLEVEGSLLAFYGFAKGRPQILAQVITAPPLSLIYVIPFRVAKDHGLFSTRLSTPKISTVKGVCAHQPHCLGQPQELRGLFGHISQFALSLHRVFSRGGERRSVLSGSCPAFGGSRGALISFVQIGLDYVAESLQRVSVVKECEGSAGRHLEFGPNRPELNTLNARSPTTGAPCRALAPAGEPSGHHGTALWAAAESSRK